MKFDFIFSKYPKEIDEPIEVQKHQKTIPSERVNKLCKGS